MGLNACSMGASRGGSRREEVLGMPKRKGDPSGLLIDSDLNEDEDDEAGG